MGCTVNRSKVWLSLALALTLAACQGPRKPSPPPTTTAEACVEPTVVRLDEDWRFHIDPDNIGLSQNWYEAEMEDGDWRNLAPGEPWESSGLIYDGAAWYRTTFVMPDWSAVYLGFGRVDDAATLWLNGEREMSWKTGDEHSEAQALDITGLAEPGEEVTLALRIEDKGGYGGVKGALRLSNEPRAVMGEAEYIRWLFESHADWPAPDWIHRGSVAWTMTGLPGAEEEALVRSDGAVAPWATAPTAEIWLYDPATGELATGSQETTDFSLHQGELPIPIWKWQAHGATVESLLFGDVAERALRWQVSVRNDGEGDRDLVLLLVVRPLGINKSLAPICSAGFQDSSWLWIDGSPFLAASTPPADSGAASLDEAMTAAVRGKAAGESGEVSSALGLGAATLVYPLSLDEGQSETLRFAFPVEPGGDGADSPFPVIEGRAGGQLSDTAAAWEHVLSRVEVDLPDEHVEAGVKASTAYLLLALDPKGPHPGPLTHDAMWVRDAAYIGLALTQLGHADAVQDYIPDILASQEADGRIPPIQGDNVPWDDEEWDAQGQVIFLATRYYRYTGEREALEEWYPALRSAAQFIVDLRANKAATQSPARGLLPPSKSAEDLGPSDQHYYWDNFWAVAGLEEAAYAARELGKPEDAAWMEEEAEALRNTILNSVERVMGPEPAYIPGAVEEVESSAMARGTVPALWPVRVLSPEDQLVKRAFDTYYQRWIAPDNGGFRHRQDQFWPYGGLELAHAYLRLGRKDVLHEILGWTLQHQTLSGTFAWAEQVDPQIGGISGGDMPHAWAAASYATLIREMLLTEREGYIELFTGVPEWWFEEDRTISVRNAPTHFGALNLRTESAIQQSDSGWEGTLTLTLSGAEPPQGFRWRLPQDAQLVKGPSGVTVADGWLTVPSTGGSVQLAFSADS